MTTEVIPIDVDRDREQWLALRTRDITASDIGAVCGVDTYRTPLDVWAAKSGKIKPGSETNLMRRGKWFEPAALRAIADERPGWKVRQAGVYLTDPDRRMGATPDAIAFDPDREGVGIVQIKTVTRRAFERNWFPEGTVYYDVDEIEPPLSYQLQTIQEAKLGEPLGVKWAVLAALVVAEYSADLYLPEVTLSEPAWARMQESAAAFWRSVETGTVPVFDPERDREAIRALYPTAIEADEPIDLSADTELRDALDAREAAMKQINELTKIKSAAETAAMARLGEYPIGLCDAYRISWKVQHRKGYTVPPSDPRVLRITTPKGK